MEKIIFATKNQGKLKEIREIMKDLDFEIISMEEAGIDIDILEDGTTFEENATKKATEIMRLTNCITMSDDSGLEIDAMDKAPGVYSARFMGEDTPYEKRFERILSNLYGVDDAERSARFISCIVAIFPDGRKFVTQGTIEGLIGWEAKGDFGFGYDPIFYIPEKGRYMAQLSADEKNSMSHRGKALEKMKELLKKEIV